MLEYGGCYPPVEAVHRSGKDLQAAPVRLGGVDDRGIVAARAEHDRRVGEAQPVLVVSGQVVDNIADEAIAPAGHHETDGEADRMSFRRHETESSKRAESAGAFEVHVQHHAAVFIEKHVAESVDSFNGVRVTVPHLLEVGELVLDELSSSVVCPHVSFPAGVDVDAALNRLFPLCPPLRAMSAEGDVV